MKGRSVERWLTVGKMTSCPLRMMTWSMVMEMFFGVLGWPKIKDDQGFGG